MSHNIDVFRKEFDKDWFARFRASYENINPDRPLESAGIDFKDTFAGFRAFLDASRSQETIRFVDEFSPLLGTFLQGPFPVHRNRVLRSAWDCRGKLGAYDACGIIPRLGGARVLDVGCNAGYDAFLMKSLGALEVVGIEPHGFYYQAAFLNAVYDQSGVRFVKVGWEDLDPRYFSGFDVVNCQGLIYHVREPLNLIERVASVMRPGATLLLETHALSEESAHAFFIEGAFWGDQTYWWIFGDQCLAGMLRSAGFKDVRMPLKRPCDSRNPANPRITVEGHPAGSRAWFVASKA